MNSQLSSIPIQTAAGVLAVEILVCCSGFNGPLRQYFSLYRAEQWRGGCE